MTDNNNFGGDRQDAYRLAVTSNAEAGALVSTLGLVMRALGDDRCQRRHRVVVRLIAIAFRDGVEACPPADWLAEHSRLSIGSVYNTLSDLTDWNYLQTVRKSPAGGGRAIAHYTAAVEGRKELERAIERYLAMLDPRPDLTLYGEVRTCS